MARDSGGGGSRRRTPSSSARRPGDPGSGGRPSNTTTYNSARQPGDPGSNSGGRRTANVYVPPTRAALLASSAGRRTATAFGAYGKPGSTTHPLSSPWNNRSSGGGGGGGSRSSGGGGGGGGRRRRRGWRVQLDQAGTDSRCSASEGVLDPGGVEGLVPTRSRQGDHEQAAGGGERWPGNGIDHDAHDYRVSPEAGSDHSRWGDGGRRLEASAGHVVRGCPGHGPGPGVVHAGAGLQLNARQRQSTNGARRRSSPNARIVGNRHVRSSASWSVKSWPHSMHGMSGAGT